MLEVSLTLVGDAGITVPYFPADSVTLRIHVVAVAGSGRLAPPHIQTSEEELTQTFSAPD